MNPAARIVKTRSTCRFSATYAVRAAAVLARPRLTRSSHSRRFTPFTVSHKENDVSASKAGTMIAGNIRDANARPKNQIRHSKPKNMRTPLHEVARSKLRKGPQGGLRALSCSGIRQSDQKPLDQLLDRARREQVGQVGRVGRIAQPGIAMPGIDVKNFLHGAQSR
jgi:hypothetical protein